MDKVEHRLTVRCGYGRNLTALIDSLSGKEAPEPAWIMVEQEGDVFYIVDNNMTEHGDGQSTALGLCDWDGEVEDLDNGGSDESQCFGFSDHLSWNDVHFVLDAEERITAPSLERLNEALAHVVFCAWCPGDI